MKKFEITEPWMQGFSLAECPFWEEEDNVLRLVNPYEHTVHRIKLDEGPSSLTTYSFEYPISVTAELHSQKDSYFFAGKPGVGIASKDGAVKNVVAKFWTEEDEKTLDTSVMTSNDGAVDCKGRFWVGTMCDPRIVGLKPEGILFMYDPKTGLHRKENGLTVPNGISWSKDNTSMFFADSATWSLFKYDFDAETGAISNKRVFWKAAEGTGPDGHVRDQNDNIWTAVWGAWKVVCLSPAGEVIAEIALPTRCVTAVVFCGEDLYITSMNDPEGEKYPESVKHQGSIFKCHVGVRGQPVNQIDVSA